VSQLLLVASARELPAPGRTWGTGGWLQPESREALDWLTFARLSGWSAAIRVPGEVLDDGSRWVVIACDPNELGEEDVLALRRRLNEPLLVVARAAAREHPLAALAGAARAARPAQGTAVAWHGPGPARAWCAESELQTILEVGRECAVWATLDGFPLACARHVGTAIVVTLGFHPSRARDTDGVATALLRQLLVHGAPGPVAWLDFAGTLVLRMDDPGGAQNVHCSSWRYVKLGECEWRKIATELRRRRARMSVAYTPGWVDDGDEKRGSLVVDGRRAPRRAGAIWDSPRVVHESAAARNDYASEFRGIEALRAAGLVDVELHGHTHLHPDRGAWSGAPDRYEAEMWYREFGQPATAIAGRSAVEHPLELGTHALERIFGAGATTFVPPGDQFHDGDIEMAHRLGFSFVASYYLALRDGNRFCWCQHVCAPYLDLAAPHWLTAGLPVVGYFHDKDGIDLMRRWLDAWTDAGVTRMIAFRDLAAAVGLEVDVRRQEPVVTARDDAPRATRPIPILIKRPNGGVVRRKLAPTQ
jgi:hypothetical protein